MSEIPDDIAETAMNAVCEYWPHNDPDVDAVKDLAGTIGRSIQAERDRCISIIRDIETRNAAEAHLIETIVRRIRGDE